MRYFQIAVQDPITPKGFSSEELMAKWQSATWPRANLTIREVFAPEPSDAAVQSESPVLLDALRKLHSPYGIYDACEHDHKDGDPDAIQVDEIGLTCSAAKLYDICNACCGPGESDYQSLECAENQEHGPDIPICSTVALLASFQAKGPDVGRNQLLAIAESLQASRESVESALLNAGLTVAAING
jgi:hypothetical protein